MKLNYQLHWQEYGFEIDTNDYIPYYNECIQFVGEIEDLNTLYNEVSNQFENLSYFAMKTKSIIKRHKLIIKDFKEDRNKFENKFYNEMLPELKRIIQSNMDYIKNNKEHFLLQLNKTIQKITNEMKSSRAKANRKYYLKKKAELNAVPKLVPTEEELKERKSKYNKTYYEKHKPVKEETDTEPSKRSEANKKYYASKKELLERIKILELQIQGCDPVRRILTHL